MEPGYPVYSKLGFIKSSNYIFLKGGKINSHPDYKKIEKIKEIDWKVIASMDFQATGEHREELLIKSLSTGFKFINHDNIEGFYLPDFGRGLIVANTETAGTDLIRYKLLNEISAIVIPESNLVALNFLKKDGYTEFNKAPRMYLYNEPEWQPTMIYSRGAGYCG